MKIPLIVVALLGCFATQAQTNTADFGRIVLNTYLSEKSALPTEAKNLLKTKLDQITTSNGIAGTESNPRFIITGVVNTSTKDIIAGPPQMIAQNLTLTLFVGDAVDNKVFTTTTINLKGVGTNENKAFINAFSAINPNNKAISQFIGDAKEKITSYYNSQCGAIIKEAQTLSAQSRYDEAIYRLSIVPAACSDCYSKCLTATASIYQKKVDATCQEQFNKAKTAWTAEQTPAGAEKAGTFLTEISPVASCQPEVAAFIKTIDAQLKAAEKQQWQFKMKQYNDQVAMQQESMRMSDRQASRNLELDKLRVSAYRDVAVRYAENQPRVISYNTIQWR